MHTQSCFVCSAHFLSLSSPLLDLELCSDFVQWSAIEWHRLHFNSAARLRWLKPYELVLGTLDDCSHSTATQAHYHRHGGVSMFMFVAVWRFCVCLYVCQQLAIERSIVIDRVGWKGVSGDRTPMASHHLDRPSNGRFIFPPTQHRKLGADVIRFD